jgi:sigma-B regulation protein RsbU (phosphoserine phosphatase)
MFPNQKFSAGSFELENGDTLVLYTDGVPDAQNGQNEEYGMARLISVTSKCSSPPEQLVADCLTDISAFRGDSQPSFDDISIMGIRRELART